MNRGIEIMSIQVMTMSRTDSYAIPEVSIGTKGQVQGNQSTTSQNSTQTSSDNVVRLPGKTGGSEVQSIGEQQILRTVERALKMLQGPSTSVEMTIHEKTHNVMVKVKNKETGEVIREVPPEKMQDLVVKMMEIAGLLIDERV